MEPTRTGTPSFPKVTPEPYHYTEQEIAALEAEQERVKAFKYMSPEEFIPGFIPNVQNKGKVMAEAGHEAMVQAGYDSKYFGHRHGLADTTATIH